MLRIAILPFLITPLLAQSWSQATTGTNPGDLRDAAMAYHVTTSTTVLFGGWPALGDTWLYDGTDWTQATPAMSPPARRELAMASDYERGVLVMFGGLGAGGVLADTWEWNGTTWANVTPATGNPPARAGHVMAYDSERDVTVLFGGTPNANLPPILTDTWEWDGTSWTQVTTANAPAEPVTSCMCYDTLRQVCVLTGGTSFFGAPDQKTWEYDGVNWVDRTVAVGLAPTATAGLGLSLAKMVYDEGRQVCVLHGGRTPNGTFPTDTWEYDGSAWVSQSTGTPSSRTRFMMSYDWARGVTVLYGGLTGNFQTWYQETWEFTGAVSASYDFLGAGCAGSVGIASNTASALPVSGQTMVVDIGNLPSPEVVAVVVGLSEVAPPVDLLVIGAPACFAYANPDLLTLVTGSAGSASYSVAIPASPAFVGTQLFTQAVVFDAGVNALGAVVSDAAKATIGL